MICVPLMSGDELLGLLSLTHPEVSYFSESHFRLVSTVANEMSIAIHNATLYEYITDQATRLALALKVQEEEASNRKAILESMASGCIPLSSNDAFSAAAAPRGWTGCIPAWSRRPRHWTPSWCVGPRRPWSWPTSGAWTRRRG